MTQPTAADRLQAAVMKAAEEMPRARYCSICLNGVAGAYKTRSLLTAPRPIFVDSFDAGGCASLREGIEEGWVVVDRRWEQEDPEKPTVYAKWNAEESARKQAGFFNRYATRVIDSGTAFADALMGFILAKSEYGSLQDGPDWKSDYGEFKRILENCVKRTTVNSPCHVIWIFHLRKRVFSKKDPTGRTVEKEVVELVLPGSSKEGLYRLFDYILVANLDVQGRPVWSARSQGLYVGRTRGTNFAKDIGGTVTFSPGEQAVPSFREVIKSAGMAHEDMDWSWLKPKEVSDECKV